MSVIIPRTPRRSVLPMLLCGFVFWSLRSSYAESDPDADFVALQAAAKDSFQQKVVPFINTYCEGCHGLKKQKGKVNFQPALKNPGDSSHSKIWKQALANV